MYSKRELYRLHNKALAHQEPGQRLMTADAARLFNLECGTSASYVLRLMERLGLVRREGTGTHTKYILLEAQDERTVD